MSSSRDKTTLIKGVLAGVVVTKILYLIPGVNLFGPILGGATTAFIINRGPWGGLKSGFIKGIAMTLPAIILAVFFAPMLAEIPLIGGLLAGSVVIVVAIVVLHSVTLGMAGGFVSGFIAQKVRSSSPVETTAKTTATAANTAAKTTAAASNTVDSAKDTYSQHRDVEQGEASENDAASHRDGNADQPAETAASDTTGAADSERESAQNAGSGPSSSSGTQSGATAQSGANRGETVSPGSERDAARQSESDQTAQSAPCVSCGSLVPLDARFCPECGAESPLSDAASAKTTNARDGRGASRTSSFARDHHGSQSDGRTHVDHSIAEAADTVARREQPSSDAAERLCRVLSDPGADQTSIESALRDAIERLEGDAALAEAVSGFDDSPTTRQLESARSRVSRSNSSAVAGLLSVFDKTIQLADERDRSESERDRHREAVERLCRAVDADGSLNLGSGDMAERASALADAVERGDVVIESSGSSLEQVVDELRAAVRPQSPQTRRLLDALETGDEMTVVEELRTTVERFDELEEVQAALTDIETYDVRRRINSLEEELQRADGSVYRHLADRVRELEAMLEADGVDDIQLYAIYQECTFYDRTLIPRLSRSADASEAVDIDRRARDIESRIAAINDDYVSVRADHNHTIPNHFLGLADTLAERARRTSDRQPQQAAGQLAAADDVLDHVEELYQRNEYSVMLRRLRG